MLSCTTQRAWPCAVLELLVWMRPWLGAIAASARPDVAEPQAAEPVRCDGALRMELELVRAHLNLLPDLFDDDEGFLAALPMPAWVARTGGVYAWVAVAMEAQARFEAHAALRDDYARALRAWPCR